MKNSKSAEVRYRKQLETLTKSLSKNVETYIIPLLRRLESQYTNDSYAKELEEAFDRLRMTYSNIETIGKAAANAFVNNTNTDNKKRFYTSIENAVGIDLNSVIQSEGLENILTATVRENVNLIKSIPDEYFKSLETIVFTGTTQGSRSGSMIDQIKKLNGSTTKRARVIARDQTSKLNSAITQQRSQNLGSVEYVWRTSSDERVRESHKRNNGKTFRWDDPPETGHPGQDIMCRCIAQVIIEV